MGSARTITTKLNAQHALQLALYGMRNDKAPTKRRQLMLHINLLGAPEIYLDDQLQLRFRTRKAQALLIYLATTERSWSRDALATLFWPETSDATALKNLRDILPSLRRQLGDYLLLDNEMIGLNPASGCKCDVIEFQTLLEGQLQQLNTEQLAATLRLYRGEFLEGYSGARISADFELWAVRERERFHQLALMGFTTFCRRKQERGDYEAALGANRQILKLAPWDEAAHRQQMLLLAQSGQQAAALAHFETCCQILADELDIKPMPETTALYQQIRLGEYGKDSATKVQSAALETSRTDAHPQFGRRNHALPTIPHNLPTSLLKHIGYADELDYVQRQLFNAECRLLTIVGTGGVGKTHLALEAARHIVQAPDAEARFGDGVYFVPLDGVHASPSPELVEAAIASAIGKALDYTLSGSVSPQLQLQKRLEGKKVLLVLDNMEHLLTGALLMTALLQRAAYLSILVTSREKLNLRGEHLLKLTGLLPLPLPTPAISDPNAMGDSANSAAALFVYHAQLVNRRFAVDGENRAHIERICALVDGLPLGIEMAAKWVESLDLATVATKIAQGLDFLEAANRNTPQRHEALRTVFNHSWALLAAAEQTLLARLAIFQPGFPSVAAIKVTDASLRDLSQLVNKSLLRRDVTGQFAMHRSIRHYAREKLDQWPEDKHNLEERYVSFYLDSLVRFQDDFNTIERMKEEAAAARDFDNVRSALQLAVQRNMWADLRRTALIVGEIYDTHGWYLEGIRFCESAAERLTINPPAESLVERILQNALRGQLIAIQGWYQIRLGQFADAFALLERSLAILRQVKASSSAIVDDLDTATIDYITQALGQCLGFFGWLEYFRGEFERALVLLEESAPPERKDRGVPGTFVALARIKFHQGLYPAAQTYVEQGMRLARERGVQRHYLYLLTELGRIQQARGNYAAAEAIFLDCYDQRLKVGDQSGLTTCLLALGEIARLRNNFRAAQSYLQRGIQLATEIEYFPALPMLQWGLGNLALQQDDYRTAKEHFLKGMSYPGFSHLSLFGQPTLGWVYIMCAEYAEAEQYLHQVVEQTWAAKVYGKLMEVLGGLIVLLAIAGELESPAQWVAQIENHPATPQETKERIRKMYDQIARDLSSPALAANHEPYYPSPKLRQVVAEILEVLTTE